MKYEKSSIALIVSFVILLVFALTLRTIIGEVRQAVLDSHWFEVTNTINLIADQADEFVEQDDDWYTYSYTRDICIATELLDARQGVFCALFDENGYRLSEQSASGLKTYPYDSDAFCTAIDLYARGEIPITMYSNTASNYMQTRAYFRWIPSGDYDSKLLLVVAISDDVLIGNPTERLVLWCVAMLAVGGLSTVVAGVLIATRPRQKEGNSPSMSVPPKRRGVNANV